MSLDVTLISKTPVVKKSTGIFIRENGMYRELTIEEVQDYFQSIVKETEDTTNRVYEANITHNLGSMARAAGIYEACWRPEEIGAVKASDIIPILERGFKDMRERPEYYKEFNAKNGWGTYDEFVPWVESYLNACREYPDAIIKVSR